VRACVRVCARAYICLKELTWYAVFKHHVHFGIPCPYVNYIHIQIKPLRQAWAYMTNLPLFSEPARTTLAKPSFQVIRHFMIVLLSVWFVCHVITYWPMLQTIQ